jgi:hypothetical protein
MGKLILILTALTILLSFIIVAFFVIISKFSNQNLESKECEDIELLNAYLNSIKVKYPEILNQKQMENRLINGRVYKYINENADYVIFDYYINKFRVYDKEKLFKTGTFAECMQVVNELIKKYDLQIC